jgi:hypothetical protein
VQFANESTWAELARIPAHAERGADRDLRRGFRFKMSDWNRGSKNSALLHAFTAIIKIAE